MRSGVQWNQLPQESGDDLTTHRWFQRFVAVDVLKEIWALLVVQREKLDDLGWT
jgi:transposase